MPLPVDPPLARQHYGRTTSALFCQLVLQASTSIAGASAVLAVIWPELEQQGEVPHPTTGRSWLLRLGLYKLRRPKAASDDWVWLADHVVQIGTEKCLMVVGVRLPDLPPPGQCLELRHLEPLAILPVNASNQHIVQEQLEEIALKQGVPAAILSDEGSDLLGGVRLFCETHAETLALSDVAHFGARLLKRHLEQDDRWKEFCRRAGQTKCQTGQTELAFLTPPAQRSKARFMNLGPLLAWAGKTLAVLDQPPPRVLEFCTSPRLEEKFGWLRAYRDDLALWSELEAITQATIDVVRRTGYARGVSGQVAEATRSLVTSDAGEVLQAELITFVSRQSSPVADGQRVPGSTEILESSFGQWKSLEGDQQKGGFTPLLLSYAALLGETTTALIATALTSTLGKHVQSWSASHLGLTLQSKRVLTHRAITTPTAQQNPEER